MFVLELVFCSARRYVGGAGDFCVVFLVVIVATYAPFNLLRGRRPEIALTLPTERRAKPVGIMGHSSIDLPPISGFAFIGSGKSSVPINVSMR